MQQRCARRVVHAAEPAADPATCFFLLFAVLQAAQFCTRSGGHRTGAFDLKGALRASADRMQGPLLSVGAFRFPRALRSYQSLARSRWRSPSRGREEVISYRNQKNSTRPSCAPLPILSRTFLFSFLESHEIPALGKIPLPHRGPALRTSAVNSPSVYLPKPSSRRVQLRQPPFRVDRRFWPTSELNFIVRYRHCFYSGHSKSSPKG